MFDMKEVQIQDLDVCLQPTYFILYSKYSLSDSQSKYSKTF